MPVLIQCYIYIYGDGSKPWYLVNPKIAGKWMFIPLKMVLIGIDPYPYIYLHSTAAFVDVSNHGHRSFQVLNGAGLPFETAIGHRIIGASNGKPGRGFWAHLPVNSG